MLRLAVKRREYLLSFNHYKEPEVIYDRQAVSLLLLRLIIMDPGADPLHPDMGVGIRKYRYSMDNEAELTKKIEDQIHTYLPYFSDANITLVYTPDHTLNVEIESGGVVYVYESDIKVKDITLEDISTD